MNPRISDININTVDYWDGIYRGGLFPTNALNNTERYRVAASLQIGTSALDIGCGQGGLGRELARLGNGIKYTGVDFSQEAIDSTVYPDGRYLAMGWADVRVKADTVYILELLEHVDEPAALLARAASLAKRRLVISTPRYGQIPYELHRGEHMWDFTAEELVELLSPYGVVGDFIPAGVVVPRDQGIPAGVVVPRDQGIPEGVQNHVVAVTK